MGHYEDSFYEIYDQIRVKNVKDEFENQLKKMNYQSKHKYKSTKEMWEYAYMRVTSSNHEYKSK
jgi:hypothetical protein|tara:strand:- start:398 stop:589 length:192 start_codon:yes stop_codon:yes gene_type:complete